MSGIDSIQRRAWIAAVRVDAKAMYSAPDPGVLHDRVHREEGGRPAKAYRAFTTVLRALQDLDAEDYARIVRRADQDVADAVERINRAYERANLMPPFHRECCKPGDE